MDEYIVVYQEKEYKFTAWKDVQSWIEETVDQMEEQRKDVLEYQRMIMRLKEKRYILLDEWIYHN